MRENARDRDKKWQVVLVSLLHLIGRDGDTGFLNQSQKSKDKPEQ